MISAITLSPLLTTQEAFLDSVHKPVAGYWKVVRRKPAMSATGAGKGISLEGFGGLPEKSLDL